MESGVVPRGDASAPDYVENVHIVPEDVEEEGGSTGEERFIGFRDGDGDQYHGGGLEDDERARPSSVAFDDDGLQEDESARPNSEPFDFGMELTDSDYLLIEWIVVVPMGSESARFGCHRREVVERANLEDEELDDIPESTEHDERISSQEAIETPVQSFVSSCVSSMGLYPWLATIDRQKLQAWQAKHHGEHGQGRRWPYLPHLSHSRSFVAKIAGRNEFVPLDGVWANFFSAGDTIRLDILPVTSLPRCSPVTRIREAISFRMLRVDYAFDGEKEMLYDEVVDREQRVAEFIKDIIVKHELDIAEDEYKVHDNSRCFDASYRWADYIKHNQLRIAVFVTAGTTLPVMGPYKGGDELTKFERHLKSLKENLQHGENVLEEFCWARIYEHILHEGVSSAPKHGEEVESRMSYLMRLFKDFVTPIAQRVIEQQGATLDVVERLKRERTYIPQLDIGGLAGGKKYKWNGVLFKIPCTRIDHGETRLEYHSTYAAFKTAKHDFNSARAFADACRGNGLTVPMTVLVEYRGYRVLCQPFLPLDQTYNKTSLVYGSCDGGRTIHADPHVHQVMKKVCKDDRIKLCEAELVLRALDGEVASSIFFCGPRDLEIRRVTLMHFWERASQAPTTPIDQILREELSILNRIGEEQHWQEERTVIRYMRTSAQYLRLLADRREKETALDVMLGGDFITVVQQCMNDEDLLLPLWQSCEMVLSDLDDGPLIYLETFNNNEMFTTIPHLFYFWSLHCEPSERLVHLRTAAAISTQDVTMRLQIDFALSDAGEKRVTLDIVKEDTEVKKLDDDILEKKLFECHPQDVFYVLDLARLRPPDVLPFLCQRMRGGSSTRAFHFLEEQLRTGRVFSKFPSSLTHMWRLDRADLCCLLRPEAMWRFDHRLHSPEVLTGFGARIQPEVRENTEIVSRAIQEPLPPEEGGSSIIETMLEECDINPYFTNGPTLRGECPATLLVKLMHQYGVNLRYLGRVFDALFDRMIAKMSQYDKESQLEPSKRSEDFASIGKQIYDIYPRILRLICVEMFARCIKSRVLWMVPEFSELARQGGTGPINLPALASQFVPPVDPIMALPPEPAVPFDPSSTIAGALRYATGVCGAEFLYGPMKRPEINRGEIAQEKRLKIEHRAREAEELLKAFVVDLAWCLRKVSLDEVERIGAVESFVHDTRMWASEVVHQCFEVFPVAVTVDGEPPPLQGTCPVTLLNGVMRASGRGRTWRVRVHVWNWFRRPPENRRSLLERLAREIMREVCPTILNMVGFLYPCHRLLEFAPALPRPHELRFLVFQRAKELIGFRMKSSLIQEERALFDTMDDVSFE